MNMKVRKLALHWQMLIALCAGIIGGYSLSGCFDVWGNVVQNIGNIFLRAINMMVIPLVFLSTLLGISTMNGSKSMGRIAIKTFLYFIITSVAAALVGVVVTNALRPGYGTHGTYKEAGQLMVSAEQTCRSGLTDRLVNMVPDNIFEAFVSGNTLPIVFFSLMFGFFITKIAKERQDAINVFFGSLHDVIMRMTNFIIGFAPIGIFAIIMSLIGGQADSIDELKGDFVSFAFFVIVVWIALVVMGGMILPILLGLMANVSPVRHLRQIYSTLLLAFSTSSSYSALPMIISDARDKFGVSNNIAGFIVPLGITFNKIGTIIYECVAVIFVAQAFDVELSVAQQISLIGMSIVTVLGAPAVPMAGVVVLVILLKAMNLPDTYIGMFMAIDILCDMPKTLLNVYSVSCSAVVVAKSEGEKLKI